MRQHPLNLFSIPSILFLITFSQFAGAQTPRRDYRPRTASISGRVTISGAPVVNAVVTVEEVGVKPDSSVADPPIPFKIKTRTDGDGRYLAGGLAEGRYAVQVMLKAFVTAGNFNNPAPGRTVTLDEGEARDKIDFALIRGGVITGKVMDDEGVPLIARRVRLYTLDEQGQKQDYSGDIMHEMTETDDRGVYRIYGLHPGRYIISAGGDVGDGAFGGGSGNFPRTYHPDTTDEKQAGIIEIKEGSEITDVDIRLGRPIKTYEAAGRVIDRETGKPVPGIYVFCSSKRVNNEPGRHYSTTAIADGQGNFRLLGLPPGLYQAAARDYIGEGEYTSEVAEFEVTNDNVSGVEVQTFLGASVSGFVTIEGVGPAVAIPLQSIYIFAFVTPPNDSNGNSSFQRGVPPVRVKSDGSFAIKGLQAGGVGFLTHSGSYDLRVKRIERDGVEIKDAIEVRPGERVTGVRIVVHKVAGRLRGQIQITGGALPENRRFQISARQPRSSDEAKSAARSPVLYGSTGWHAVADEKGRFVIERLLAGEYDLFISLTTPIAGRDRWVSSTQSTMVSKQRVTIRENEETHVKIPIDLNRINQPNNQPNDKEERR